MCRSARRRSSVTTMPRPLPSALPGRRSVDRCKVMSLQGAARSRLATYDKNICPQCSAWLLAPDWSEHLNKRCVRHSWSRDVCGHGLETAVFFPELRKTAV